MIKMHDVLFGEFIEIENDKNILIVDCGCENKKSFKSEKSMTFKEHVENCGIIYCLIENKKYAMISHFHEDHINGFVYLENCRFHKVFVPYISSYSKGAFIFKKALLAYLFGGYGIRKSVKSYLYQVELVAKLSAKRISGIVPVGRGDKFEIGEDNHEILWPPKLNSIEIHLTELNSAIIKLNNDEELSNIIELIDKLFAEYNKYLDIINTDNINNSGSNYNSDNIISLLNDFYGLVAAIDVKTIRRIKDEVKEINKIIKQMNGDINKTSIVDLINGEESKSGKKQSVLLTGDITKDIFENILVDDISSVTILKAPHHGTNITKHYSDKLPDAKYVLISNGKFMRRKIVSNYTKYLKSGEICCTHGTSISGTNICEIKATTGICPYKCTCYQKGINL